MSDPNPKPRVNIFWSYLCMFVGNAKDSLSQEDYCLPGDGVEVLGTRKGGKWGLRGVNKLLRVMGMFGMLIVVMISQMCIYTHIFQH